MSSSRSGPIGVFDSGVGGLTVLRAIHTALPDEPTVYLGDTARVPYGTRSPQTVVRYALNNARFLRDIGQMKLLVVACNTVSAVALGPLEEALDVPVVGVVEPGARAAAAASRNGRIAVIGTRGTISSGAYQRALAAVDPAIEVLARACPLLVPLAEEGWHEGDIARRVIEAYLGDLAGAGFDTLVLGCTHYPLLQDAIAQVVGEGVTLIDSAQAVAAEVVTLLAERGLSSEAGSGTHRMYVTDLPEAFDTVATRFLGSALPPVEQIDIESGVETKDA